MAVEGYDPDATGEQAAAYPVYLCSGEAMEVITEAEQRWWVNTKGKYLEETRFTETTDLQDLDRLLCLELLIFRWNLHLSSGRDYDGNLAEEEQLRRQIKDQSDVINKLKSQLSLDKKSRDAILSEGNFAAWISDVKRRAKLFGIHRENQLQKALALMAELSGTLGAFDRSDEEERRKLGFESEADIVAWIRDEMLPAFQVIDEHFANHEQKLWARDI